MWHEERLEEEWFAKLVELDRKIAQAVAAEGCRHCGGRLHQGNYERKPRGGEIAGAGEAFKLRYSLCCGREGCRKRALPPSLRFLGRRVYLEGVVLLASAQTTLRLLAAPTRAMGTLMLRKVRAKTGVSIRTLLRWHTWWTQVFPLSPAWTQMRARFVPPPPKETELPQSLLDRLAASLGVAPAATEVLRLSARWLLSVTTQSVPDGSRFAFAARER